MRTVLLARGLVCLSVVPTGGAAAVDPRATIEARSRNSCHGPDGYSYPGHAATELYQRHAGFQVRGRTGTIMGRLAKAYSDAEIRAMAQYFNHLK